VEEYELKLQALRNTLNESLARGGDHSDEAVGRHIGAALDAWETKRKTGDGAAYPTMPANARTKCRPSLPSRANPRYS
jgi:hypothetical protein